MREHGVIYLHSFKHYYSGNRNPTPPEKKTITEEIKYQRTLSLLTEGDGMVRH